MHALLDKWPKIVIRGKPYIIFLFTRCVMLRTHEPDESKHWHLLLPLLPTTAYSNPLLWTQGIDINHLLSNQLSHIDSKKLAYFGTKFQSKLISYYLYGLLEPQITYWKTTMVSQWSLFCFQPWIRIQQQLPEACGPRRHGVLACTNQGLQLGPSKQQSLQHWLRTPQSQYEPQLPPLVGWRRFRWGCAWWIWRPAGAGGSGWFETMGCTGLTKRSRTNLVWNGVVWQRAAELWTW